PTSTTVSIVFELLGAAVAVSIVKVAGNPNADIYEYINTGKALAIISGILLSVVVAFSIGSIVQFLTRIIFSFEYNKKLKYFGAIWGGIAITAITYFILIKGLKGSSFAGKGTDIYYFVTHNTFLIITAGFVVWTVLLAIVQFLFKANVLKIVILVGTFALAVAFAGNDLVNFIGVPLAGLSAYKEFLANPSLDPTAVTMAALAGKVQTPSYMLLIAGMIMVVTLYLSKKSKRVLATSLDLSRQDEGEERFEAYPFSRALVRASMNINKGISKIVPKQVLQTIESRFEQPAEKQDEGMSFDLLRASVNLVVASIIISFGTSLKLPLSTTYVTFMVAMGTSLSDKAWGRESAVYRISGVITIIGGWFFTAFIAFSAALVFAFLMSYGGMYAIVILIVIAITFMIRTHLFGKKKENELKQQEEEKIYDERLSSHDNVVRKCNNSAITTLSQVTQVFNSIIEETSNENRNKLKELGADVKLLARRAKDMKSEMNTTVNRLEDYDIETSHNYVQIVDYLREMSRSIREIYNIAFEHVDNNHKPFSDEQKSELTLLGEMITHFSIETIEIIKTNNYSKIETTLEHQEKIIQKIDKLNRKQIKRIKKSKDSTKRSMLYLAIIFETKNIMHDTVHILKIQQRFTSGEAIKD
ncbi:MAG: inorganic phosphate transporter, partial [Bacteroidota bacterium]|nr:inorganic phosphate transporter [Bacteroidota bacterium]